MIREGVLDNPEVDNVLGLHVWQDLPAGTVGIKGGLVFASIDLISLTVKGKGGHGGVPHKSIDPIIIAAHIISALDTMMSREIDPLEPCVLTFGQIHSGSACNVIPAEAFLQGTFRCFNQEIRVHARKRIKEISTTVAEAFQARCEADISHGYPPVINDEGVTARVVEAAQDIIPETGIIRDCVTLGSEDMSLFLNKRPGSYILLGTSNKEKGLTNPHHSPNFDIDEEALPLGVEVMKRAIEKIMQE
jgi:amidohydrolase